MASSSAAQVEPMEDDGPGLYVSRKLTPACAEAFTAWATEQGFANLTPADELHTTIVYSKTSITLEPEGGELIMLDDGNRLIQPLGDKGAVVLRFGSVAFKDRWQRAMAAGASWDYEGYHPHVTITYDAGGKDLSTVIPFAGPLVFGPEAHAPLDEDWAESKGFRIAQDEAHETDLYGRVHLTRVPISKANICPYKGSEIPTWKALGLEPDKIYQLLRDPEELAKAHETSNGVQLLITHTPLDANDHKPYDVAGSIGTSAEFEAPYVYNDVTVWTQYAIDGIEDESRRELSSSYGYKPDMTPGKFEGQAYDGVMRDLHWNHVALVVKGRAGPDVAIDEHPPSIPVKRNPFMTKKIALLSRTGIRTVAALSVLAMDAKIDFRPALKGVTAKNLKARTPALVKSILAMDGMEEAMAPAAAATGATPDDVILKCLEMVQGQSAMEPPEADEAPMATTEPNAAPPAAAAPAEGGGKMDKAKIMEWLKSKGMGDDDMSELDGMMGNDPGAEDEEETEEEEAARMAKEKAAMDDKEPMVTKTAMDAALKASRDTILKTQRDINQAAAYVRPWVGELAMDESISSATDVYRKALGSLGVAGASTLHADALKAVLDVQAKPSDRKVREPGLAMDSATVKSYAERFPTAMRING